MRLRPATTGSALVFGSALDTGLNSLLIDLKDGRTPDVEKAKAAFCQAFLTTQVNGETKFLYEAGVVQYSKADLDESILTSDDQNSELNKSWLSLNRKGQMLIEEYAVQALPRIQKVYLVQHEIALSNETGDKFTGIIDFVAMIDGKIYICDNKSTSITYKENSANESEQLATYYEALRDQYDIAGVCYVTIPKKLRKRKKPLVDISFIFGTIDEALLNKTFENYDKVLTGIRTAKFECTPDICCSTPWGCQYKAYCRSGGKDTTGLLFQDKKK